MLMFTQPVRTWPRRLLVVALVITGTVGFCAFVIFALIRSHDPPDVWQNPPIYPGAQDLRSQDLGEYGTMDPDPPVADFLFTKRVITYTVADTPDKVDDFYSLALRTARMKPVDPQWIVSTERPRDLIYEWVSPGKNPTIFFLDVTTTTNGDMTLVEVRTSLSPGR